MKISQNISFKNLPEKHSKLLNGILARYWFAFGLVALCESGCMSPGSSLAAFFKFKILGLSPGCQSLTVRKWRDRAKSKIQLVTFTLTAQLLAKVSMHQLSINQRSNYYNRFACIKMINILFGKILIHKYYFFRNYILYINAPNHHYENL